MNDNNRNQLIINRIAEGVSLSDIQKELQSELNLTLTYMDLRLLIADLENLEWKKEVAAPKEEKVTSEATDAPEQVVVSISKIVRPNCSLNGSVSFPSGITGEWYVDQRGGLGLDCKDDLKPNEEELMAFQQELQRQVTENG